MPNPVTLQGPNTGETVIQMEDFKRRFRPVFNPQRYMDNANERREALTAQWDKKDIDLQTWIAQSETIEAHQNLVANFLPIELVDK